MNKYDDGISPTLTDPQAGPPAAFCSRCGQELYWDEQAYRLDGRLCCCECLADYARGYFLSSLICLKDAIT